MKIGILTFHRSINYGAFMQCYALSHTLQARYPQHQVEVIDFEYPRKHNSYLKPAKQLPFGPEYYVKYRRFQSDLKRLNLSDESFITNDTDSLCEYIKSHYDVVIVGSDAVWAFQKKMPIDNPYWLFGKKLNGVVKMSYAASAFTTIFDQVTREERDAIRESLSDFYYIGVRDIPTQKFIQELSVEKKVHINHDPTFFLEPANDKKMAQRTLRKNLVLGDKPKISFMTRLMPHMNEVRNHLHKDYQLLHFYTRDNMRGDLKDFRCRFLTNLSPFEWYNLYSQMSLNLTYFFHGACLALINHIPTIAIDDATVPYMSKYAQLMNDLGLQDNLFSHKDLNGEALLSRIDYLLSHQEEEKGRIVQAIAKERQKSESFFQHIDVILN